MIAFSNVAKTFSGTDILKGVDGHFEAGKVSLIIGSSGAGKSVLIKCLVGLIQPDQGHVTYDGKALLDAGSVALRQQIGMLFQSSALFDSQTVFENIRFPLDRLDNIGSGEKRDHVYAALEQVGLPLEVCDKMPSDLSGGMQKRVGLARAIVSSPKYLFCDEPNSGLDPKSARHIDELIQKVTRAHHITTVVVTHDLSSIVSIGDAILFLNEGRKAWEGTSSSVLEAQVPSLHKFVMSSELVRMIKDAQGAAGFNKD